MRTLVVVTKQTRSTSRTAGEQSKEWVETITHYVSNLVPQGASRFARLVRGHWGGCEIRNHWVRDALFKEDATLSKNVNLNGNLAVMRCALIALKSRHASHLSWPETSELASMNSNFPYNLICNHSLK